jgi:hypothetical protein
VLLWDSVGQAPPLPPPEFKSAVEDEDAEVATEYHDRQIRQSILDELAAGDEEDAETPLSMRQVPKLEPEVCSMVEARLLAWSSDGGVAKADIALQVWFLVHCHIIDCRVFVFHVRLVRHQSVRACKLSAHVTAG